MRRRPRQSAAPCDACSIRPQWAGCSRYWQRPRRAFRAPPGSEPGEIVLTLAALDEGGRIVHGFFTREGGVSQGRFASLNCGWGSGDDLDAVRENRTRAMARMGLGAEALATVYQVHSARVEVLDAAPLMDGRPEADAMVTTHPGLALGILTADCVPVLLADPTVPIIGAAHAGWKGARDGVVEATVAEI